MPPRIRWFSIDRLFPKGSLCPGAFFHFTSSSSGKIAPLLLWAVYFAKGTHSIIRINIVQRFLKKC